MDAKCKNCNQAYDFHAKKGRKLSEQRCKCGGVFERMIEINNHRHGEAIERDKPIYTYRSSISGEAVEDYQRIWKDKAGKEWTRARGYDGKYILMDKQGKEGV